MIKFRRCWFSWSNISLYLQGDIITEAALRGVQNVLDFLKYNVRAQNLLQRQGFPQRIRMISSYIRTCDQRLRDSLARSNRSEVFAALRYFLLHLRKPLIPHHIQTLALDNSDNTQEEIIAQDMLGLISQDLRGRHLVLVTMLLDCLYYVSKNNSTDELASSEIPVTMLPVFFNLQPQHLRSWSHLAVIVMEMINWSPVILPLYIQPIRPYIMRDVHLDINNNARQQDLAANMNAAENQVVRVHLVRGGFEGDANFPEVINIRGEHYLRIMRNIFGFWNRRGF